MNVLLLDSCSLKWLYTVFHTIDIFTIYSLTILTLMQMYWVSNPVITHFRRGIFKPGPRIPDRGQTTPAQSKT